MITVNRYCPALSGEWDHAVGNSRNGTFMHLRPYMDYHADRFDDFSLIARDARGRIVAVLPAERTGGTLRSHGGLTYGGWLMSDRADMNTMTEVWNTALEFLADNGIGELIYKPVPHIYHRYPAEEDLYCLFRSNAVADAVQVSSAIDLNAPVGFDTNSRRNLRRALKTGLTVSRSADFASFMQILTQVLAERHGTQPVHSLAEIELLASRFPDNIALYGVFDSDRMVAGTIIYLTHTVAHAQYIASGIEGRANGALALLFNYLIKLYAGRVRYFDFGISCEEGGRVLNTGLVRQKNGFGARAVTYNSFRLSWQ